MAKLKRKELYLTEKIDMSRFEYISLNEVIANLQELRNKTGGDARLEFEALTTYYDDTYIEASVSWYRMETDEEYEKRCKEHHKRSASARKAAKARKEKEELEERALYEKLKKKYD